MGKVSEKLEEWVSTSDEFTKTVALAEEIYAHINWAYNAYSTGKDILTYLGYLNPQENQFEEIKSKLDTIIKELDNILKGVDEAKKFIEAHQKISHMMELADVISPARTAAINAYNYLKHPDNLFNKTSFLNSLNDSMISADILSASDAYWLRIYSKEVLYSDEWSGIFEPTRDPNEDFVWDYGPTLIAYLKVIAFRNIVYLATGDATYHEDYLAEMQGYAKKLKEIYEKILNGFEPIRPPTLEEMKFVVRFMFDEDFQYYVKPGSFESNFSEYDFIDREDGKTVLIKKIDESYPNGQLYALRNIIPGGKWRITKYIFGMVEKYSGHYCTGVFPSDELEAGRSLISKTIIPTLYGRTNFNIDIWGMQIVNSDPLFETKKFQEFYNGFLLRHILRTLRQSKQLYKELGLDKLRETIYHVYEMYKLQTPLDLYEFTSWSLKEVYKVIPGYMKGIIRTDEPISFRKIVAIIEPSLAVLQRISLRKILLVDEV